MVFICLYFLYILLVIISLALIVMLAYGIYFIIATVQLIKIKVEVENLWGFCSYAYYFMDESKKEIFETRVKNEVNRSIEKIDFETVEESDNRPARLKEAKEYVIELYEELLKKIEKSVPLAKECADDYFYEIEDVVNIIKDVLNEV